MKHTRLAIPDVVLLEPDPCGWWRARYVVRSGKDAQGMTLTAAEVFT
jgi:hypothetical protein